MATLLSAGLRGIDAYPIHVEVDTRHGLPGWSTVGLAESAVKESKERVLSAIHNCGYEFTYDRITLNLAPADIKKSGTAFDLPVAVGLLAAARLLPKNEYPDYLFVGELSLNGYLRPIRGVISITMMAKQRGIRCLVLPHANAHEASLIDGIQILGAHDLPEVVEHLLGQQSISATPPQEPRNPPTDEYLPDFKEVKGQACAKRSLEVAAAGFHNIMMVGPPGSGKSMLAQRLPSILEPLSFEESLESTKIYSLMGLMQNHQSLVTTRPFRAPHHTISDVGLIGGGPTAKPGEITLAHNGVLFLDELTEFRRNVLESLRQPLENHSITVTRAMQSHTYPSRFVLVAAMNPCPCGQYGNPKQPCLCPGPVIQRYQSKISGPLLDRMDLQIEVPPLEFHELIDSKSEESSADILKRVKIARRQQTIRFMKTKINANSQMGPREIKKYCQIDARSEKILELAIKKWSLSARAYSRILKVARTIADLSEAETIQSQHISEAIGYRCLDKKMFY